jgi:polysaccharide pyruvyl transferase WcaK-like protein
VKKELAIGLEGAVINNGNMGCVALTCSLINMLERISDNLAIPFKYYVFEGEKNKEMIESVCKLLEIEKNKILSIPTFHLYRYRAMVHHPIKSIKTLQEMKKCDVFIDLTAGDSFADIYGDYRFNGTTDIKLMIERMGIPLIMGPQTYGPYNKKKNLEKAKKAIDGARCVIARDQMSADYVSKFSSKHVYVTTDLAFGLPFHNITSDSKEKIKIGLNASSLLVKNKTEETETKFKLKTNYDQYLRKLLSILTVDDKYEIHVIPHVERDAGDEIKKEFPNLIYLEPFENPISAKNYISQMDIFIGARMHATIGAFSAGVATIPTAYSRKFKGLYENLEYRYVVDLAALDTMDAVKLTVDYVEHYRELKFAVDKSLIKVNQKTELTYQILHEQLKSLSEKI